MPDYKINKTTKKEGTNELPSQRRREWPNYKEEERAVGYDNLPPTHITYVRKLLV